MAAEIHHLPSDSSVQVPTSNGKAIVIGLYGIPGCGKSFLLHQLKETLSEVSFTFHEGSERISAIVDGGLEAFKRLDKEGKEYWRECAIDKIGRETAGTEKAAIVTGHYMFWPEDQKTGDIVITQRDLTTYTHIIYLDVPAAVIEQRRLDDKDRSRDATSVSHLSTWQNDEKNQLRRLCRLHGIMFSVVAPEPASLNTISRLVQDSLCMHATYNQSSADDKLDEALGKSVEHMETVLVMDADRTLAPEDAGMLFWKLASECSPSKDEFALKKIFSSPLGYSYNAFRQAMLLCEEMFNDEAFEALCDSVATTVRMYPELVSLLQVAAQQSHVGVVVITCGLRRVWEKVLEREGLSGSVILIGGGRIADRLAVTADVKGELVNRLQNVHKLHVWAFGDSPLDLDMLCNADQAIVVVGTEEARSMTMDVALENCIDGKGLRAQQIVLPHGAPPRLDTAKLPLVQPTDLKFVESVLRRGRRHAGLRMLHATEKNAAKLLMTPMRDAAIAGPALREAHRRVGLYLATEFLPDLIGVEDKKMQHVQGHFISGHQLWHESQTTIVALMRGGEPMAYGVNDAFPLACLVHAGDPEDVKLCHIQGQLTIVLVDSVVNNGATVLRFVQRIRSLHGTIRIVVVAGVVQDQFRAGAVGRELDDDLNFAIVALRLSERKFTGKGSTDTGNRLFNTTHIP